jgi:hypothetical protein
MTYILHLSVFFPVYHVQNEENSIRPVKNNSELQYLHLDKKYIVPVFPYFLIP